MRRFIHVRRYKRSIGKRCMHCGRPATTTAMRKTAGGKKLAVRYCHEHDEQLIQGLVGT